MVYVHQKIPPHLLMTLCEFFTGGWMCGGIDPFFYLLMKQGWIKLFRSMMEWQWYDDIVTRGIFIHCLLRANHTATKWHNIDLEKGQFVTSLKNFADENGISVQTLRTHLKRLKSTGELTIKTTNKYSIVTVCNYSLYQCSDEGINMQTNTQPNKQLTSKQQTNNNQLTTDKNEKNIKNEINIDDDDFFKNSFVIEPEELKIKKVAAKKEMDNFVFPQVEETDYLKTYFDNPTNIEFWGQKYPLLSIEKEFAGIYASLQKKAANGNVQLSNPYSYVKKCLENAEQSRQQRVVAQRTIKPSKASKASAAVSDWSNHDFYS